MKTSKAKIRTFSALDEIIEMLDSVARYHQLKRSGTITALIKKEFWRIFPQGTLKVPTLQGAKIERLSKPRGRNHR